MKLKTGGHEEWGIYPKIVKLVETKDTDLVLDAGCVIFHFL